VAATSEVEIQRPREEVFGYLAHGEKLPDWVHEFEEVEQESEGEPSQGTTYRYRMRRGGESTFEWSEFEPGRRIAWDGPPLKSGPGSMRPRGSYEVEDADGATRVRMTQDPEMAGFMKLMAPFIRRSIRRGGPKGLERLKEILEGGDR
jgi:uncharacterized protein YndB with AHSA1/START domain